jgi:hypothetical protein
MLYVKLSEQQAKSLSALKIGYTSGKKDPITGKRESIRFCSKKVFIKTFGHNTPRQIIEI